MSIRLVFFTMSAGCSIIQIILKKNFDKRFSYKQFNLVCLYPIRYAIKNFNTQRLQFSDTAKILEKRVA